MTFSVTLMGRHTLFRTVVQGYRVTEKYAQRGPSSLKAQWTTQRE